MIKIFDQKCSKRLSTLLSKARDSGKKPDWIGENAWPGLQEKWGTAGYKKKCEQAATNKVSNSRGGCIHRGGQTSGASFHAQFFQDNERDPTMLDVHEYFHKKPDGTWDTVEATRVQ
ncbi:hypothetical protein L195_g053392, partial [Trifolium pratense]